MCYNGLVMKKYSKEAIITAIITAIIAGLSYLLSSCSGLQTSVRGISNIYRLDTVHTVYYYDHPQRSTIKVDY